MQDRIRELVEQATTIEVLSGRGFDTTQYIERFDRKKFAELIVKECSKHISDRASQAGGAGTIVGEAGFWIADDLEKHFGVEE